MKFLSGTIVILLLISGCASMSGDECAMSDWHTVGFEDGSRGYTADRLGTYRKDCAKHGVAPDLRAYQAGRDEGLQQFCQPSRGFHLGANGGRYHGVCDASREPAFLEAYRSGSHLHALRSNVSSAIYQINAKQQELEQIKGIVREKQAALISQDSSTEERIMLLADLKDLSERAGQLESEIDALIEGRARHEEQLAAYESSLTGLGY